MSQKSQVKAKPSVPAKKPAAAGAKPAAQPAAKPAAPKAYGERRADQQKGLKPAGVPAGVSAGPSQDDRGIQMPKNQLQGELSTRMLKYEIADGGTVITLAAGLGQGLHEGMNVELVSATGKSLAEVEVYDVKDRLSKALVHMTPDALREHDKLLLRAR